MPEATLVLHEKFSHRAGIVELLVWSVPEPVPPSSHGFKYRLVYIVEGVRVIGYDNERGKGDHRHLREAELVYTFTSVETLLADFWQDVEGAE